MWRQFVFKHLDCFFGSSDPAVCLVTLSYVAKGNRMNRGLQVECQLSDFHQKFLLFNLFQDIHANLFYANRQRDVTNPILLFAVVLKTNLKRWVSVLFIIALLRRDLNSHDRVIDAAIFWDVKPCSFIEL